MCHAGRLLGSDSRSSSTSDRTVDIYAAELDQISQGKSAFEIGFCKENVNYDQRVVFYCDKPAAP